MRNIILLDYKFKKFGWFLLITSSLIGVYLLIFGLDSIPVNITTFAIANGNFLGKSEFFKFINLNFLPSFTALIFILGGLIVCLAKTKTEDEYVKSIRVSSFMWAITVNYFFLTFSIIFIHGTFFLQVMLYNMFTVLLIYIIRFHFVLWRITNANKNEKYN